MFIVYDETFTWISWWPNQLPFFRTTHHLRRDLVQLNPVPSRQEEEEGRGGGFRLWQRLSSEGKEGEEKGEPTQQRRPLFPVQPSMKQWRWKSTKARAALRKQNRSCNRNSVHRHLIWIMIGKHIACMSNLSLTSPVIPGGYPHKDEGARLRQVQRHQMERLLHLHGTLLSWVRETGREPQGVAAEEAATVSWVEGDPPHCATGLFLKHCC